MTRRAARTDDNQGEIAAEFIARGASVAYTHMVGEGFPDLVIGYRGLSCTVEIKDGRKPPSARKLRQTQVDWHAEWRGMRAVVKNLQDAADVLKVMSAIADLVAPHKLLRQ